MFIICIINAKFWQLCSPGYIYIYIYYRFIVRFPIGLDFPFITLTPFPRVLMKSIGAAFFQPDALPDVNAWDAICVMYLTSM